MGNSMSDTENPKRASLEGLVGEIFKLVSRGATDEQWADWLRVPLEHAPPGNVDLSNTLRAHCTRSDTETPNRASLEALVGEIFKLVSRCASGEQWAEWLRVPLEHAAAAGNFNLSKALIGAGANGGAGWRGCEGRTLLDAAAQGGSEKVVAFLLAAGAHPDVNVVSSSSRGSALYLATCLGHREAALQLIVAGADVNFRNPGDRCYVIFKAAEGPWVDLVTDMLVAGASPNTCSGRNNRTPLHVAAWRGSNRMVLGLLAKGADKDALDSRRLSPLMIAAQCHRLAVVKSLLAAGADVEIRDAGQLTALSHAAGHGHVEALKVILGQEADVNAAADEGPTALHVAALQGQARAVDALIEAGADIEPKYMGGMTPLCLAAQCCRWMAVCVLLQHGANSYVRTIAGENLLHLACRRRQTGLEKVVELLLRFGVDETAVNHAGKTPAALTLEVSDGGSRTCSPEEVERAQLLLIRAPIDRAWRRRCWLVMLNSRVSRAKTAGCSGSGVSEHGSSAADGRGGRVASKMARSKNGERHGSDVIGQAGNGCAVVGICGEDGSLGALVASLIGLELEGVFRIVVGFL